MSKREKKPRKTGGDSQVLQLKVGKSGGKMKVGHLLLENYTGSQGQEEGLFGRCTSTTYPVIRPGREGRG